MRTVGRWAMLSLTVAALVAAFFLVLQAPPSAMNRGGFAAAAARTSAAASAFGKKYTPDWESLVGEVLIFVGEFFY